MPPQPRKGARPRRAPTLQIQKIQQATSTAIEISSSDHHTTMVVWWDSNGDNDCGFLGVGSVVIAWEYPAGFGPNGGGFR